VNIAALTAIRTVLGPMTSEAKCREVYEAVLLSVREPSAKMLHAGFVSMNQTPSGEWKRLKAAKLSPKELFVAKMTPRFTAMIDGLLAE